MMFFVDEISSTVPDVVKDDRCNKRRFRPLGFRLRVRADDQSVVASRVCSALPGYIPGDLFKCQHA